jgi:hypothetical protein
MTKKTTLFFSFLWILIFAARIAFSADLDLTKALKQTAATGNLDHMEFEYWTGGGLPPPYYVSKQLRIRSLQGQTTLVFNEVKYDKKYNPSNLVENSQVAAKPEDVKKVAQTLLDTRVYSSNFPEEKKIDTPDVLSTEIIVTLQGKAYKKIYYKTLPAKLEPVHSEVNRLIELAKAEGKKTLIHQGTPVSLEAFRKAADANAAKLGYDLSKMWVSADEDNSEWKNYSAKTPYPDIEEALKGKDFVAFYYSPQTKGLGSDLWVFVDRKNEQVITLLRGK